MTRSIRITSGELILFAELSDNDTADTIWNSLPFEGFANLWGDEVYFSIPVDLGIASYARQEMAVGEVAYWPAGSAMCIFFGPTPVSKASEPRAYTDVNPFGKIEGDLDGLREIKDGDVVKVERR